MAGFAWVRRLAWSFPTEPLRDRNVRRLWAGTSLGALGAEAFNIALIWSVVERAGIDGGFYLAAVILLTALSGIAGGALLDRAPPFRTLALLDAARAVAGAASVYLVFVDAPLWTIMAGAALVVMTRPHIDAAAFGGIARLDIGEQARAGANALVDSTFRMARIAGPIAASAVALAGGSVTVFAFAAACFVLASVLVASMGQVGGQTGDARRASFLSDSTRGFVVAARSPLLAFTFLSQAVNAGAWYLGFIFTTALIFEASSGGSEASGLGGFGTAVLFYGLGNVAANILTSGMPLRDPAKYITAGRLVAGFGYLLLSLDFGAAWLFLCAALAASGTPPADLAFLKLIQSRYQWGDVAKLCRVKIIVEYLGMRVAMISAPVLLSILAPPLVVGLCGLALLAVGTYGAIYTWGMRRWPETETVTREGAL
ncbi:hypothetical protein [Salinarimonas rosea]|uniref:hypothetical protein n=1 Tax=Salinarimonas rosea TaxID=552063 RepID=UPI00040278A0|nr:hypothetical protein [Salinarimonas rosea]